MTEPATILIIDDSEDDRMLYRRVLQKSAARDYHVAEATNGEEGMERIPLDHPKCVLLDYSMPGRNGVEVLKRLRSKYPFVPVVMLTGQGNEAVAVTAMREGAQNYISKSTITPESLEHAIRMAIEYCTLQKYIHEQRTSLEIFTRALAHDLKEPVRTIRSFMELIAANQELSEESTEYFEHVQRAARRMESLIETVYLYTRLDAVERMEREACNVGHVLNEVRENLSTLIKERDTTVSYSALPEVLINRAQLIQLLQNLISNAIHHSDEKAHIEVSAREQESEWLFAVRDNGPGIAPEYVEKIFEPFKRMTRHKEQGTGLGLAICRKIVESYGGHIWCESEIGKGSTFFFTLPKTEAREPSTDKKDARASGIRPVGGKTGQNLANVLLVDDNEADIELTRILLFEHTHLQCDLSIAHDGQQAWAQLTKMANGERPVDLLLLDINMPRMDGFELLEKIRQERALHALPVLMCSTSIYDKDVQRAKSLGAAGYLTKPAQFSKFKAAIEKTPSLKLTQDNGGLMLLRAAG